MAKDFLPKIITWFRLDEHVRRLKTSQEELEVRVETLEDAPAPSGDSRPYKIYTALLTQTGTSAPVATVLENTLGDDITYNSLDGINNTIQSNNLFTENKTYVYIGNGNDPTFSTQKTIDSTSIISFIVSTSEDAMLNTPIEIRVYN